jgi:hypothetical protein
MMAGRETGIESGVKRQSLELSEVCRQTAQSEL